VVSILEARLLDIRDVSASRQLGAARPFSLAYNGLPSGKRPYPSLRRKPSAEPCRIRPQHHWQKEKSDTFRQPPISFTLLAAQKTAALPWSTGFSSPRIRQLLVP
jgi:hypothetical protein